MRSFQQTAARGLRSPSSSTAFYSACKSTLPSSSYIKSISYTRQPSSCPSSLSRTTISRSRIPPASSILLRSFHQFTPLADQANPQKKPAETQGTKPPTDEAKPSEPESEQQKSSAQEDGAKSESGKTEGEGEGEKADGKDGKKEDAAPPPPHGDKTPWQVFTETLNQEFKASKEWNEGTKQLASGYQEFTQNPTLQKTKGAISSTTEAVTGATGKVLKSTATAVGSGAAWTWDTSVMKGVRAGANATGRGLEKATRPIRETEAYKSVKETIDDGSSSRYGGWRDKEERKRLRELREAKEMAQSGRKSNEPMVEDPEAGTNVTLHKDSAWNERWNNFKENSRLAQSLFNMKSTYAESENPLISTARSITDRIAGFFAENETAMVIKKFREMDPNFKMEPFLQEMREYILPEVLDAYVKGDLETLKLWLSAAQFSVYSALMQQYTTNGLKSDGKILDIRHVDIVSAKMLEPGDIPIFLITCRTQEVHVYRKIKTGELAAGMDDNVQLVTYVMGLTRIPEDVSNPETRGWKLIELQKSARNYI